MTTHAVTSNSARSRQQLDRRAQYRRRARRSDLLVTLLWASGAIAAALFLSIGGAAQFATASETVTSLGILAGLVGSDFILVMLVLAARIPFVDRTIGHDRAMAVHRQLGKPSLYLLLAHAMLLLAGYGMSQSWNVVTWVGDMWALPDMPLAFLGLGLMILVVVTSLVAVRKKFSYEGWHLVHLLSYLAVAFAIPHQLSNGGILTGGSVQRAYWICLYVLAFGSILVFRFAEPLVSSIRHDVRVRRVEEIAPGVVSIHLGGRDLDALGSAGGQFFVWRFWTPRTWWHAHPISLSAAPTARTARITIRDLGAGSARISSVPIGTRVWIEGPYGLFSDAGRTAPKLAVLAAGIGITPARALLESSTLAPGEATIALRATDDDQTYLWDEVRDIAQRKGARMYALVGPRGRRNPNWLPQTDRERGVTLRSIFPDLLDSDLYVCGPTAWLDSVEAEARAAGLPAHQLHSERFDW
jgi:predicted ferric reductase